MSARQPTLRFEVRRNAILDSAVQVMNRKGVRGMTLGEVAANLGLVPTGVIYYFKNKEELAQACLLAGMERFNAILDAGAHGVDPRARISLFLEAHFEFRRRVALGEEEALAAFNDVRALNSAAVNEAYVGMFRRLRGLLEGAGEGTWSRPALNARTHLVLSEVLWTVAWLHRRDAEDYPGIARRMIAMTCDGLASPGAVWSPVPLPPQMSEASLDPSEQFLRAATALINEEGYLGASVEKISARLNVTKGAFYHHNDTKDDLVQACFQRTFEVMRQTIRRAEAVSTSGYQTLCTIATALVDYQMSGNAPLLRTSALTSVPEAIQPALLDQFDRIAYRFASIISDGVADGSVRPVEANIAAQMITGMINASADLHFWTPGLEPASATELYVRPFFEGLLGPAAGAA
jgi:AcrR family transcriptional regulator